ncbi:FAD dependent oxidoreductase [Stachybotrys elegans]|uniref:FAD dependent oxidoreductase n=1 Tax=Stachybotrys elegans TaxID=80388 RepID=A0A8K0SST4_9HYPO|nr:FAD dependent oxidoreductase [Stachybotrys elegans]
MERNPSSVLIVGAGVFGLSTALALTKRSGFEQTSITVVDDTRGSFPPPDGASIDSSRIIRGDYADPVYTELAALAQEEWRKQGDDDLGGQGRYTESGMFLTANEVVGEAGVKGGMSYTKASWKNALDICRGDKSMERKISEVSGRKAIQEFLGVHGHAGDWGYINRMAGWADAEEGMKWLHRKVVATGRVKFVDAQVKQLVTSEDRVTGAEMADGTVLKADVTIVAAGAWTGTLIDLRGRAEATGQVLGYIDISDEEANILKKQPVVLNLTTGLFIIPPRGNVLKAARHGWGYHNPQTVTTALPLSPSEERKPIVVSCPMTGRNGSLDTLPAEADRDLRRAFRDLAPVKNLETRPWKHTRLCWYSDTVDGDWLVDWHPGWKGLFVATGDSGHGYKFLPVLGDKLVDCLVGEGGELAKKWRWKDIAAEDELLGREVDGVFKGLQTKDGSRGGAKDMVLEEELRKTKKMATRL